MKYYIGGAILFLALIGGYVVAHKTTTLSLQNTSTSTSPVLVNMIQKTVNVWADENTKKEVVDSLSAYEGNIVETLSSGRGLIQLKNGTITVIDYSTKIKIKAHSDDEHASLFLSSGKVWATVKKVFGKGEYYEIETQNAVAVVRGTSFGLSYINGVSHLEVTEGVVAFVPIDPKTGERLYDKTVLITAGNQATIKDDGVVVIVSLKPNDKKEDWYIFNNEKETENTTPSETQNSVRISNLQINGAR
jgi:hypothetical protein